MCEDRPEPPAEVRLCGGAGSALIMALRQLGSAVSVAVLRAVAGAVYRAHLDIDGLPPASAHAARRGISAGLTVAHQRDSEDLLRSARAAFVHGVEGSSGERGRGGGQR
ncbi:hypothetical protein [Frankia sp. EAN1pec]|uniref:hypothetical protein n=1 Tax=Parafrankia sp. (strain EAN1pec) TaxID=298653 RepID=UPI0018DBF481